MDDFFRRGKMDVLIIPAGLITPAVGGGSRCGCAKLAGARQLIFRPGLRARRGSPDPAPIRPTAGPRARRGSPDPAALGAVSRPRRFARPQVSLPGGSVSDEGDLRSD